MSDASSNPNLNPNPIPNPSSSSNPNPNPNTSLNPNPNPNSNPNTIVPPDNERFLIELEFVQNLSNPKYLSYLAQNRYYEKADFMDFLRYLQYFRKPAYLKHLIFPQCLAFLDALINNPVFREVRVRVKI
jgi:hypothetical protein